MVPAGGGLLSELVESGEALSINDVTAARLESERAALRHFSLIRMNRASGIRRSVLGECPGDVGPCGRKISANKTHCAEHALTIEES